MKRLPEKILDRPPVNGQKMNGQAINGHANGRIPNGNSAIGNGMGGEAMAVGTQAISIPSLEVRKARKGLALTVEHFGLLLGVSPSSIFRYENIGVSAFHQGPVARKLCLLASWLSGEGNVVALRAILAGQGGLAILAGLLETGSVMTSNLPFEAYSGGKGLPSAESLAESILMAFRKADALPGQAGPPASPEDTASRMEAEARIAEAEARMLEAQARKLEAQARIKSAEGSANG
ncbi:MAG: hypothetical protein LBF58_01950 [Deltaproteobacteria bacterium]|jgi:transcriptional regulator with XRE-family HTH domain|nr:hypothetical protein [Deltaproteobacteria bacterium]